MNAIPDRDLVIKAQAGDRQAFGHLVDRYHAMTLGIARRFVHVPERAEELAQESLLQAYLSLDKLRDPNRFKSWLYGIVQNTCRNHLRSQKPPALSLDDLLMGDFQIAPDHPKAPDPYQETEDRDLYQRVLHAINTLSERPRETTMLFYYEHLSHNEIAKHLGISVSAVKSCLFRARKQLADLLAPIYPEYIPTSEKKTMIEVTVTDIVPMPQEGYEAIVLLDSENHRVLPLTVPKQTGSSIRKNLDHGTGVFGFMNELLTATDTKLEKVELKAFSRQLDPSRDIQLSSRLAAMLSVRHGKKVSKLKTWVNYAIPLAACTRAPIYIEESVLDAVGKSIPEEFWDAPEKLIQALTTFVFQKSGPVSQGFQQAVQEARESARRLCTTYIGSEHLLLGLLSDTSGPGVEKLKQHEIDPDELQAEIESSLKGWELRPGEFQRVIQAEWKVVTKLPVDGGTIHEGRPVSLNAEEITLETQDGSQVLPVADIEGLGPKDKTALLETAPSGYLHIHENGYGFVRPTEDADTSPDDIYISQSQIQNFHLKHGDYLHVDVRPPRGGERYNAAIRIEQINHQLHESPGGSQPLPPKIFFVILGQDKDKPWEVITRAEIENETHHTGTLHQLTPDAVELALDGGQTRSLPFDQIHNITILNTSTEGAENHQIPFVPRTQQVLEGAAQEAAAEEAEMIDTHHLLLALAKAERGVAAQILAEHEVTYETLTGT